MRQLRKHLIQQRVPTDPIASRIKYTKHLKYTQRSLKTKNPKKTKKPNSGMPVRMGFDFFPLCSHSFTHGVLMIIDRLDRTYKIQDTKFRPDPAAPWPNYCNL